MVILLSVTQLIILQAACFLFCSLMSTDFSIWWNWSFSKILHTIFLDNITMLVEGNEISMN